MPTPAPSDTASDRRQEIVAAALVVIGLVLRLILANQTFLNPDEGVHSLYSTPRTLGDLYNTACQSHHPPLLFFLLYVIKQLSLSEVAVRLPAVIAGAIFPWVIYRWLALRGRATAGLVSMAVLMFAPNLVALGAQVRGYTLALLFLATALYCLDRAIRDGAPGWMALAILSLLLGVLSEYFMVWFCAVAGIYFLTRIREDSLNHRTRTAWLAGQLTIAGLCVFLYLTHISIISRIMGASDMAGIVWWMQDSYYQPSDNPVWFVLEGTYRQFAYVFASPVAGLVAITLFAAGVVTLRKDRPLVLLLIAPFVFSAGVALARLFPYGLSRHAVYFAPFMAVAIAVLMAKHVRPRALWIGVGAVILAPIWHFAAVPDPHNMPPERQKREHLVAAFEFLDSNVPPGSVIVTEMETRALLAHYYGISFPPESEGSVEFMGDYGFCALRFNFTNLGEVRDDLSAAVDKCGISADEPAWVMDSGFYAQVYYAFERRSHLLEQTANYRNFGEGIVMFQALPGFDPARPESASPTPAR